MSDWMFDDGSAGALLNQDYTPPVPPVWDEPEPQGAPSQDPLFGDDPPVDEVDEVVVTGYAGGGNDYGGGGGGGAGGGNWPTDTTWLESEAEENLPCTPPADPDNAPAGVDMDDLRNVARDLPDDIRDRDNSVEWGALIYTLNGQIHATDVVSQGQSGSIGFEYRNSEFLPDGAHIVGWIHNHPYDRNIGRQDGFGADDEAGLNVMAREAERSGGRFTADEKVMTYTIPNDSDRDPSDDPLLEFDEEASRGARGTVIGPCRGS